MGNLAIPAEIDGKPVTAIEDESLKELSGVTSINIGENVKTIGMRAFEDDVNVTTIIIDENSKLETIGYAAFRHCDNLESLKLPGTVTKIECEAFSSCKKLRELDFEGTIAQWNAIEKETGWKGYINTVHCTDGDVTL